MKKKYGSRREQAQSLVELALSFMIVMFLLSGIVDIGRAFFILIELRDASQEGAIYASLYPATSYDTETINRVLASSTNPINLQNEYDAGNLTVTIATQDGHMRCAAFHGTGSDTWAHGITVTVTYTFPFTMPLIQTFIGSNTMPLRSSTTNTILYPICPCSATHPAECP